MTEKEKATEYAKSILHCEFCTRCNGKQDKINNKCEQFNFLYGGYLDGLAEGKKEKWHDLRKNPNDLPIKNDEYLCFVYEHGYEIHRFNISKNCFLGVFSRVIAWCELPKFEG